MKIAESIPGLFSRRVQNAAMNRMKMVTGMAAMVKPNSKSCTPVTMTRNWTVNPKKKKKSNFNKAI